MASKIPATLVVGADSLIGSALMPELLAAGWPVIGTTRRAERAGSMVRLDLKDDVAHWESPAHVDVVIICAGVTALAECADDPEGSGRVNIDGITALAQNFGARGSFVVHLSTNLVFNGDNPLPGVDAAVSPITEYGRQKAEAEKRVLALKNRSAVLRMTKVLGKHNQLLDGWVSSLKNGEPITPFSDINFSPVPLGFVVSVLKRMAKAQQPGVFHISGEKDVSYEYAARMAARVTGADAGLVRPCRSEEASTKPHPKHTTLDTAGLVSFFGKAPPPVDWTLNTAFTNPGALAP